MKYIFFDCMETLIDLTELPGLRDYAMWAYKGSGVEGLWESEDQFFQDYIEARKMISDKLPLHREYEVYERLEAAVGIRLSHSGGHIPTTAKKLYDNYWSTYRSKCYAAEDTMRMLERLSRSFRLGVVSNFMVTDGIEELLSDSGIIRYFDFVITSIREGWRKPHASIYASALSKAQVKPDEVVFVGDDYVNDYVAPGEFGMKSILLDRFQKHMEVKQRIGNFDELTIDRIIGIENK